MTAVNRAAEPPSSKYVLSSATKVLEALRIVCQADGPVALSVIAGTLGISEVAAFRAVETLVAAGYVTRSGRARGGYQATWQVVELASALLKRSALRTIAAPVLSQLALAFDESVTLAVPDGGEIVFVDRINSSRTIEFYCDVGRRLPLHIGAAARSVLAHLPTVEFDAYVGRDLVAFTSASKQEPRVLRADRDQIRADGYAVSLGDVEVGISSVGAVVRTRAGAVLGAAAVANISARWSEGDVHARGEAIRDACAEIAQLCERAAVATDRRTVLDR